MKEEDTLEDSAVDRETPGIEEFEELGEFEEPDQASVMYGEKTLFSDMLPEFKAALKLAEIHGYSGERALLAASRAIKRAYDIDLQDMLKATHIGFDHHMPA